MKRYTSLGDLIFDYREHKKISQSHLAAEFDVDVRTIIRWEKNETLLKPEKEEEMVDITFIPYQVIRNLNAPVAIPIYYDFYLRKYSLSSMSNQLPEATWLKERSGISTNRIRTIHYDSDINNVFRCALLQTHINATLDIEVLRKAISILPELNLIMFDSSNYYSGHSVFLPLNKACYEKLKHREMKEKDIGVNDLIDYKKHSQAVFYAFDINSDCNENLFYLSSKIIEFFKSFSGSYLYAAYVSRTDSYTLNNQLGINLIWEEEPVEHGNSKNNTQSIPRFYEGNFSEFLNK